MLITYYLTDRHGPGNLRALIPAAELYKRYGWSSTTHKTMSVIENIVTQPGDVYVMQRQTRVELVEVVRSMVQEQGLCVIGEVDDWFLGLNSQQPGQRHAAEAYYTIQPKILGACSAMTVSTAELKEGYGRIQPNITVIPNYLDWNMWDEVVVPSSDRFRVGWMGGVDWHLRDLAVLKGIIGPWIRAHPDVDFVAAGDDRTHKLLDIPEAQRITYDTVPFLRLPEITATMDVGLVPLAQSRFNDAKSYLKGMEYAACGIPCIASPSREYQSWVDDGVNGFLATRPKDWIRVLNTCYEDRALVRTMGAAARDKAADNTIQKHVHEWHEFFTEQYEVTSDRNRSNSSAVAMRHKRSQLADLRRTAIPLG